MTMTQPAEAAPAPRHTWEDGIGALDFDPSPITAGSVIDRIVVEHDATLEQAAILVQAFLRAADVFIKDPKRGMKGQRRFCRLTYNEAWVHDLIFAVMPDGEAASPGSIHADLNILGGAELIHGQQGDNCGYGLRRS